MGTHAAPTAVRILIINPNTSTHMTDALKPVVESLGYDPVQYTFFTCPSPGIPSINSPSDAAESARLCLPHLLPLLPQHDAFLVACYSQHPLVPQLKRECAKLSSSGAGARKYVTGIFEASVLTSLGVMSTEGDRFGIVSTGKVWESALQSAVDAFLGRPGSDKFAGCETTGLNASELHDLPLLEVREKMMQATKRLLRNGQGRGDATDHQTPERGGDQGVSQAVNVNAICLGCAGMVGLDEAVRTACIQELGDKRGNAVHIVDGVKAGVGVLFGMAKTGF